MTLDTTAGRGAAVGDMVRPLGEIYEDFELISILVMTLALVPVPIETIGEALAGAWASYEVSGRPAQGKEMDHGREKHSHE